MAGALPHRRRRRRLARRGRILAELAAEVQRRQESDADGPEVFLFIHDLPRFRDLRRREDDFSFSQARRGGRPRRPPRRDPPRRAGLGVHVIVWCDTVNNLNRYFAHQMLREFEMRVLFQMSPTDSGHLLDAPAASKLGPHRALFYSEEQNRLEKFRPYGIPSEEWLGSLGKQLSERLSVRRHRRITTARLVPAQVIC